MSDPSSGAPDLFEHIPTAIHVYSVDAAASSGAPRFVAANPAARRALGEGAQGAALEAAFPALRGLGLPELCDRVARSKEPALGGVIRTGGEQPREGRGAALHVKAFPLGEGRVGVAFEDVSAIEDKHDRELRELRNLVQTTIDCVPDVIFVKSAKDGSYLLANAACGAIVGASPESLLGKQNSDYFPPEVAAEFDEIDRKIIAGRKAVSFEESVPMPGQDARESLTTKTPFFDGDGRPLHIVGYSVDITARKRTERALEKSHAELTETKATLQDTIRELSTPVLPIHDGVLVVPLVGHMDSQRSSQLTEALLSGIQRHRAAAVIIDITGVEMVDTAVAGHLIQTTRAASLLGAECVLVGIAPQIARTMTQIGIDFSTVTTCRDLQAGVSHALTRLSSGGSTVGKGRLG